MLTSGYLGLDTSNYTTSAAYYLDDSQEICQVKQLLPVKAGEMGLRQSDAVFHHTKQLPDMVERLRQQCDGNIAAVAASDRPTERDGSYMPCFLVGAGAAREFGALLRVPVHFFTHQQGHVAAALYGSGNLQWRHQPFLAFHVSGGTTDVLYVKPHPETVLSCELVASSLDLKAGQLVDRVGGMLGLPFPAGPALEQLALLSVNRNLRPKISMDGAFCHLSGVENQCRRMLDEGAKKEDVALFCLLSIQTALCHMTDALQKQYGTLPIVYAGGVMSNSILRKHLSETFGGQFAPPVFAADNAAGIAVLCKIREGE